MKYTLGKICLGLVAMVLLAGCEREESQIYFADGTSTQASHWDDRWIVINYWAEWCGPCRHEIPEFNQLHAERKTNGLVVLGVNYDGLQGEKLAAVIERMDVRFPTLVVDPQVEYGFERAMTLPMTVLINPDREVHDILFGPQTVTSILAAQAASS